MKRAPRTIAAAVLLGSLSAIPFIGSATAAAKAPKTVTVSASKSTLTASGGSVTIRATVKSAKTCAWSVSPKIKGFDDEREVRGEVEPRCEAAREHDTEREAVHVLARHGERQGQGVGLGRRERKGEAGQVDR